MSRHRYRVLKTAHNPNSYNVQTGWTAYCECGWVGTEEPGGKAPDVRRHVEYLDHLRALPADPAAPSGAQRYPALVDIALAAIRSEEE